MRKLMKVLLSVLVFALLGGSASALTIPGATEITIFDKNSSSGSWYDGTEAAPGEDNEVEPGMLVGQAWDLEGFFREGTSLHMVGGFNFLTGQVGSGQTFTSGDLFIDVDGDAVYGDIHGGSNGITTVKNTFGYDYVMDLDWGASALGYTLYSIDENSDVKTSYYKQNKGSDPWQFAGGQTGVVETGSFGYQSNLDLGDTDVHNLVTFDIGFLWDLGLAGETATFHFTMGCGNDNLMGQGHIPSPEPATMILFGIGLIGLAGFGRKKLNR